MKKLLFFISLIIMKNGFTQQVTPIYNENNFMEGLYNAHSNFYDVMVAGESYYDADTLRKDGNRYGYKDFLRHNDFWKDRVFNDGNITGDKTKYYEKILGFSQNRSNICSGNHPVSNNFNWSFLGPKNLPDQYLGMITSVEYYNDNGTDVIFAGSAAGGIFKTVYTGSANTVWSSITDDLFLPGIGFSELKVIDDGQGNRYLLAGTGLLHRGYGIGIYRLDLEDTQAGWTLVTDNSILGTGGVIEESFVHDISVNPNNKSVVYATMGSKIYKSESYGAYGTWNEIFYTGDLISNNPHALKISKLIFHPADTNILYASSYTTMDYTQVPPLIFKSVDGGDNWIVFQPSLTLTPATRIDVTTAGYVEGSGDVNLDPIYCALSYNTSATTATTEIYRFDNTANTFVLYDTQSSTSTFMTRHCFELSPDKYNFNSSTLINDPDFYFGTLSYHKGTNGNLGPAQFTTIIHDDIRDLEIIPSFSDPAKDHILIGNDGGISFSGDNGDSWINLNGPGLNITQFQGIDVAESDPNIIVGGTQDNNAYKYERNTDTWTRFAAGDVYNFQISENNNDLAFYSYFATYYGFDKRSLSSNQTSGLDLVPNNLASATGSSALPQFQHPSGQIYYGVKELGILKEPCFASIFISDFYLNPCVKNVIQAIGVCENDPEIIYVGFNGMKDADANCAHSEKLFKTVNGTSENPNWISLTNNILLSLPGIFDYTGITSLVVSPNDPETLWVSLGNISNDGYRRVIRSNDGGQTWSDYSVNLPGIPINDLEYYHGSNNGLFVATDIGLFYTSDDLYDVYGWICVNNNLPVILINDIEINYALNKIIIGTFGRGIYESDLPYQLTYTPNLDNPFECVNTVTVITGNVTISGSKEFCADIEIDPGATLTLTGNIFMAPNTEIRVRNSTVTGTPGGRLIIDGGMITNNSWCEANSRWNGIFVMGDPAKSQIPVATTQQGVLKIINGGTVQNAQTGAQTGKLNGHTILNTGGVIICNKANFINNAKDVILWPYTNFIGTTAFPVASKSSFVSTTFLTRPGGSISEFIQTDRTTHLSLYNVDGIQIRECIFKNSRNSNGNYRDATNDPEEVALEELGIGIYSVNSSFNVSGYCDFYDSPNPGSCTTKNIFNKLFCGIKAISSNPLKSITIDGNFFDQNYHGIFLNGVDYSHITRNLFRTLNVSGNISLNTPTYPVNTDIPYSLHLNQCSNYKVTENYFNSQVIGTSTNNIKVAMQISNSDANPEEVYNNHFQNYHSYGSAEPGIGILVQGDANDTDPNNLSGLQILCNDFYGAEVAGNELYTNHIALTQNGKVDNDQGADFDVKSPAGNTFVNIPLQFHDNCTVNSVAYPDAEYNTTDGLINGVTYYHHQNTTAFPLDVQCGSSDVGNSPTAYTYQKSIACPTAIVPPNQYLFRQNILSYLKLINDEQVLIDGNDTEGLLALILGNSSPGLIKNELMEYSPYLSDEVLIKYIQSEPPHGLLKDILEANSPLSKEVMEYVNSLIIPTGIRNQIDAAQTGISERQHLEARINWIELKKQQEINDLVRYHLQRDTVPDYLDSLKSIITQFSPNHSACKLASAFATQKDFIQAIAILDAHLVNHPDDALCKLQKLMIEFDQQLSWCLNPTQDQKDNLLEIKDEPHKGCIAAKGFLELIEGLPLPDYRILPRSERSMFYFEEKEILDESSEYKAYPNPANDYINFISSTTDESFTIEIFDFTGKMILQIPMNEYGFAFTDISNYSNGIYLAQLKTSGLIRGQTKFVINK